MIPKAFREFDEVAQKSFAFLVHEKACLEPTVEYWRDFYLVYQVPDDVRISVGTERGMGAAGWLGVFINIAYRNSGHVLFSLDEILEELAITGQAGQLPWPSNLQAYAEVLKEYFEEIVTYVRTRGMERAKHGPDSEGVGSVLRGADGALTESFHSGAGVHFWAADFLPIKREAFWQIINNNYTVSYSAWRCPSCEHLGNVGLREKAAAILARRVKIISLILFVLSIIGCVIMDSWRRSTFMLPFTIATIVVWVLSRLVATNLAPLAFCPNCGHSSTAFTLEGPPPTIDDRVNPLRS